MGTRADFYVGRGTEAEWLGSIAWDGHPESIADPVKQAATEEAFRAAVAAFLVRKDATHPADGWPWPWNDSGTTDYAYAFDGGKVYGSCFGRAWFDPTIAPKDEDEDGPADEADEEAPGAVFPNMEDRKAVAWGARSGVMVFGVR